MEFRRKTIKSVNVFSDQKWICLRLFYTECGNVHNYRKIEKVKGFIKICIWDE